MDLPDGTRVRKGASDAIERYVAAQGGKIPSDLHELVESGCRYWAVRRWLSVKTIRFWVSST